MLYEAAEIDGASPWQKFWHVTVPLLNPTIVFSAVIGSINFIQVSFTQVINMSSDGTGGPLNSTMTVVVYIYQLAFRKFDMGLASAATVLLFLFILALTLFQMKVLTRKFDYSERRMQENETRKDFNVSCIDTQFHYYAISLCLDGFYCFKVTN